jgi:8-oxo-dGTP diphosphatase
MMREPSISLPRSKANYRQLIAKMHARLDIGKPLLAGGPGSGRHPGYGMPKGVNLDEAKRYGLHPTWEKHKDWRQQAYGGILVNRDGHFLLREPTKHFDGYAWTWPKGKLGEKGEHPADTASREVKEETGYEHTFFGHLPGTYKSASGSHSSYYMMRPKGWDWTKMDTETKGLKWASYEEAKKLIGQSKNESGRKRDLEILDQAHARIQKYKNTLKSMAADWDREVWAADWNDSLHPRGPGGKFAETGGMSPKAALKFFGWKNVGKDFSRTTFGKISVETYKHISGHKLKYFPSSADYKNSAPYVKHYGPANQFLSKHFTKDLPQALGMIHKIYIGGTPPTPPVAQKPQTSAPPSAPNTKQGLGTLPKPAVSSSPPPAMAPKVAQTTYTPVGTGLKIVKKESADAPKDKTDRRPSPEKSSTPIPPPLNVDSSMFKVKDQQPSLGGAHAKTVFQDAHGSDWLFKPATTLGGQSSPLMARADEAVSRIASAIRPGYSVEAKALTLNVPGKGQEFGSIQKMIPAQFLRGEGGKFKDFTGRNFDAQPLQDWEVKHLQQEQVLDWLISNHDSHVGQFLRTTGQYVGSRAVIGIDKTQAFKFLGKDELSTTYHPNTVEKPPIYNDMFQRVKEGKLSFDPQQSLPIIQAAENISRDDYKSMLKPYADERFGKDEAAKNSFYDQAISRKEYLRSDFEKFYSGVLGKKFEFDHVATPGEIESLEIDSKGKHIEKLPDSEVRPNSGAQLKSLMSGLLQKYPMTVTSGASPTGIKGQHDLNSDVISKWESNYYKTDPTLPTAERWKQAAQGAGLYPEAAAHIGLLPSDLKALKSSIGGWKGSGGNIEAGYFRAGAADVMNAMHGQSENLKSRFSAAVQLEYEATQAKIGQIHPNGIMSSWRGLSGTVAKDMLDAKKLALASGLPTVAYKTMGAEGWSYHKVMGSVYMHSDLPTKNCFYHYALNPGSGWGGSDSEQEFFMAFKDRTMHLKPSEIHGAANKRKKAPVVDGTVKQQAWFAHPLRRGRDNNVIEMQYVGEGSDFKP